MAGNAEILKAYVTLAADTSSLRTSLTAASAEVEAWKRKTQVTIPLYQPGMTPGGGRAAPGIIPPIPPSIAPDIPATFTERLKASTAGIRGFSSAIQGTLGVGLRLVGWLTLASAGLVALGRAIGGGTQQAAASIQVYDKLARSIDALRNSSASLSSAEQKRNTINENAARLRAEIGAAEELSHNQRQALIRDTYEAASAALRVEKGLERLARVDALTKIQSQFDALRVTVDGLGAAAPTAIDKVTEQYTKAAETIREAIGAAITADSSLIGEYEAMLSRVEAMRQKAASEYLKGQREAFVGALADAGRAMVQGMKSAQALQAEAATAMAAETSRAISGLFSDIQRSIQSINLQNIEGSIDSIRQQVSLLARR